jgi:F0F1-type ATP synthase membrane subunit b/b'
MLSLADREATQAEQEAQAEAQAEARTLKVSAYTKLGLTEDEINAIIGAQ